MSTPTDHQASPTSAAATPAQAGADEPGRAQLFPRGTRVPRAGRFSLRIELRTVAVVSLLAVAALAAAWWGLISGSASLSTADVIGSFLGTADEGTARVVLEWRLPRIVFTLLGGAALAVSGAVFQSTTRNPLGSPDIIGLSTGAYTGALLVAIGGFTGAWATPIGAVAGGTLTGVVVYLFAWRRGVSGLRIIIVGIGVSIFLGAINTYLMTTLRLEEAMSVATWGAGTVNDITWTHVWPVLGALVLLLPVMAGFGRDMALMEMGDDAAKGLGIRVEAVRVIVLLCGVLLVSVVTAAAGPIAFVALVAPQLALRLTRATSVQLVPAAVVGALLLTASDLVARADFLPVQLPVGVVTLCLGGAYLVWLLIGLGRRGRS